MTHAAWGYIAFVFLFGFVLGAFYGYDLRRHSRWDSSPSPTDDDPV